MNVRDYWITAIGKDGEPVPLPVDVRNPVMRPIAFRALGLAGIILGLGVLAVIRRHPSQADLAPEVVRILLIAVGCGLLIAAAETAFALATWASQRRPVGEGLEATADRFSLSELDGHIRDIRGEHSKAEGLAKIMHARHLAWLEAKRTARSA